MSNSYEPFDRNYRRGLVLGLSLAEVFLILIFLLLLTSIGIATIQEKKKKDLSIENKVLILENEKLNSIKDELSSIEEYIGDSIEPTKLTELIKKSAANKKASKDNVVLKDKLKSLNEKLDQLKVIEKAIEKAGLKGNERKIENLLDKVLKEESYEKELTKAKKIIASLDQEKNKLNKTIESLGKEKGDIPPCWFYYDKKDKLERHLKIFDFKLSDDYIIAAKNNHAWLGTRKRDFGRIKVTNLIPNNYFGIKLTYSEFDRLFNRYEKIGNGKEIRSYQCRFMANVYDATSRDKVFWKNNLARVESFFYKDIKKSSWPH
jgi:hypothetical protein